MRSKSKIIGLLLVAVLISGQGYYFTTIYPRYKIAIREFNNEITSKEQLLMDMEMGLKTLPQMAQNLESTKLEVVALLKRMPPYTSVAKDLSDMMRVLETSNFTNAQIEQGEMIDHLYEEHKFIERQYTLSYTAPFSDSKAFVENLNSAYQLINILEFTTDNSPQVDEESKAAYKLLYGEKFSELVESHITFSLFVNTESEGKEAYDPAVNILVNTENALVNLENLIQEEGLSLSNDNEEIALEIPKRNNETVFKWQIKDPFTSGDNYRFIGPSVAKEEVYLGMESKEEIDMTLTLKEEDYRLLIEDQSGKSKEIEVQAKVKAPVLQITSEMTEQFSVPTVHMHIDNQTEEVVIVDIEGAMQGNLHIYNEKDEEVNRGGVSGKLIVR
ncbi:MAG: hypothetical protein RR915_03630 [Cellulosilyticaceae bacterium]